MIVKHIKMLSKSDVVLILSKKFQYSLTNPKYLYCSIRQSLVFIAIIVIKKYRESFIDVFTSFIPDKSYLHLQMIKYK